MKALVAPNRVGVASAGEILISLGKPWKMDCFDRDRRKSCRPGAVLRRLLFPIRPLGPPSRETRGLGLPWAAGGGAGASFRTFNNP